MSDQDRRVSARIAAEALQNRTSSRQETIADLEALREAELFEIGCSRVR
jgi:hypothetical protein